MATVSGMGSLYRLERSPYFYFRFQKRHVSTRTADRREAERFRKAYLGKAVTEAAAVQHGAENVTIGELLEDVRADYIEADRRSISSLNGYLNAHSHRLARRKTEVPGVGSGRHCR